MGAIEQSLLGRIGEVHAFHDELTAIRHDIHAHPETAFEERRTSDLGAGLRFGYGSNEIGFGWTNAVVLELLAR